MPITEWPTETEMTAYLGGLGVTVPAGIDLEAEVAAAVEKLNEVCGGLFQEGVEADFDYLQPRSHTLILGRYFTAITSITYKDSGDTIPVSSYRPLPLGGPFTRIEFLGRMTGSDLLVVEGNPGVTADIPQRVWNAVRDYAAASVMGKTPAGLASSIDQGDIAVKYAQGVTMGGSLMVGADKTFSEWAMPRVGGYARQ